MCPYARFQSAMFDKDTLIISYDGERGEPRAKGKKRKQTDVQVGDCVDCTMCVQVCPTGIDIREGLQYECIGCAACIDVCDQVMDKVGMPKGLIKYTTEHASEHGETHILRPRIIVYGVLLSLLFVAFVYAIFNRSPLAVDIIRDRSTLYRVVDAEHIENVYNFKVMNKSKESLFYQFALPEETSATILASQDRAIRPGEVGNVPVSVILPAADLSGAINTIEFVITTEIDGESFQVNEHSRFFAPR